MSHLEEEFSSLDYKVGYSNLTKGERNVVYSLKNDDTIIIKAADKGSAVELDTNIFIRNLQEMWKILLRKSLKLLSKKSEIGQIATAH